MQITPLTESGIRSALETIAPGCTVISVTPLKGASQTAHTVSRLSPTMVRRFGSWYGDTFPSTATDTLWFLRYGVAPDFMEAHELGADVWRAVKDMAEHMPSTPSVFSHCDFQPDNIFWNGDAISAVLDWEEAGYADPAMDLGHARMNLAVHGMHEAGDSLVQEYEAEMGRRTENLVVWELAASARLMPDPARVIPEWDKLGNHGRTPTSVRDDLRVSIRSALQRA